MKFLVLVVILTVVAGISAHRIRGKKDMEQQQDGTGKPQPKMANKMGKWSHKGMLNRGCLKNTEAVNTTIAAYYDSMKRCSEEVLNITGTARMEMHKDKKAMKALWEKKGSCVTKCFWERMHFLKMANGTGTFNATRIGEFSANFTEDAARAFNMKLNACTKKYELDHNVTEGPDCVGLKKYQECWRSSMKAACGHDEQSKVLSGKDKDDSTTDEDMAEAFEMSGSTTVGPM